MVEGCQAGGLGHLLQYMREYNAESLIQGSKRLNSIVKTIYFSYLPIIYLYAARSGGYPLANEFKYPCMGTIVMILTDQRLFTRMFNVL